MSRNRMENFMRRTVFEARLDEFSYNINRYNRASKMVLRVFRVKKWDDISEMELGKAFKMIQTLMFMAIKKAPLEEELLVG